MTDKKTTAGWIPTDTEGKGETRVLTEADMLELELVQHYGANYDDPDSFLIAIGRRDNDLEASERRMQAALRETDQLLALEEYADGVRQRSSQQRQGGADANADEATKAKRRVADWVELYLSQRRSTTKPSAKDLARRFILADVTWPEGVKPRTEETVYGYIKKMKISG